MVINRHETANDRGIDAMIFLFVLSTVAQEILEIVGGGYENTYALCNSVEKGVFIQGRCEYSFVLV